MNQIKAKVIRINATDIVTYIDVQSADTEIRLIKSKAPLWLCEGDTIHCNFNEASVCVSKDCPGKVSIENRVPATLVEVRKSDSLCELTFESDVGKIVSLITMEAFEDLELELGCQATMLLRGIDISVEPIVDFKKGFLERNMQIRS
ncbi:TOBE domain-containing protein [bacterium]|jgi:molybdopterin-binding protein|nr:TOBE domain-containing protein [bacterium]MBU1435333.1 TOBE domain-containing protein [bacterium]MBU1503531.1 TOBE domain-containing protein [bacterium]